MTNGLAALAGAGAQNIVVTGIADIGALPATLALGDPTLAATATARALALNAQFEAIAAGLSLSTGADIDFFDLFGLDEALRADPAAFGLPADLDTVATCQSGGPAAVLAGCEGYLYFDPIHPTTQVHAIIARQIAQQLAAPVPEPHVWLLMIAGFGVTGAALRSRSRGVMPATARRA